MKIAENKVPIGTVYETKNGNVYMRVSEYCTVYLFNKDFSRSDKSAYLPIGCTEVKTLTKQAIRRILK